MDSYPSFNTSTYTFYHQYQPLSNRSTFLVRCEFRVDLDPERFRNAEDTDLLSRQYYKRSFGCITSHYKFGPRITRVFKFQDIVTSGIKRVVVNITTGNPRFVDNFVTHQLCHELTNENSLWASAIRYRSFQLIYSLLQDIAPFLYQSRPCHSNLVPRTISLGD